MRKERFAFLAALFLVLQFGAIASADPPGFLKLFGKKTVEADANKDYLLTEVEGPWLIFATTFTGEQAEQKARNLVLELRSQYNVPAFIYNEKFDFSRPVGEPDPAGRVRRYMNGAQFQAYAVLVGEFDSVDHPEVEKTLKTIKTIKPKVFAQVRPEDEVGAMASIRRIQNQILGAAKETEAGPMYHAFVTRNPLLPDTFTQAPEVDSFVNSLNKNVEHSLLDCKGRYTVVVRTFEGLATTMIGGKTKKDLVPSKDRMDENMELANRMVAALRKKGVEAYEFHDRTKSIVTIGSFDELGRNTPNGFQYDSRIQQIMTEYAANERIGTDTEGRVVRYNNAIEGIPYDVRPRPIAVPKVSKRSLYMGALGLNR